MPVDRTVAAKEVQAVEMEVNEGTSMTKVAPTAKTGVEMKKPVLDTATGMIATYHGARVSRKEEKKM